jgi:hypothetical protein
LDELDPIGVASAGERVVQRRHVACRPGDTVTLPRGTMMADERAANWADDGPGTQWWIDAALAGACDGWRRSRRCVDEDGRQRRDPHPRCLAAHRRYVLAVLERGPYPPL